MRTDQGPELTGKALDQWIYRNNVEVKLIRPGKPIQNGFIESFSGRFRDECLNEHWFADLHHAREMIGQWRKDYHEHLPHSALGYQESAEFSADFRGVKPDSTTDDVIKPNSRV